MQAKVSIRYFLGANSPQGFYSLYDQLIDPAQAQAIYILKGGPGCGKSSLMHRVAQRAEDAGESVEYIQCSGDPDSLDAILLPERRTAIVDGTAPHVLEPVYPGVVESYVNLGECYDKAGLNTVRNEIMSCMTGYKGCYKRAYRCLGAAAEIAEDMRAILTTEALEEKAAKRAHGILGREVRAAGSGSGQVVQRFLGAVTHQGLVRYYDTADALCKRIYVLEDSYGLSHLLLTHLLNAVAAAGYDVVACPSPLAPDRLEHLLIPGLSLAFLSACPALPYDKRPYRRIRIDAMVDAELARRNKARLRFSRKVSSALIDEAVDSLAQAKAMHDELESLYNPHVDFDRVYRTADELAGKILNS
ncbi:MAG: hypothetical protein ACI4O5_07090 [Oscillospiraceae bacterium]